MKPLTRVFSFCAASTLLLAIGCGSNSTTPAPGPTFTLYVVQNGSAALTNSVLQFPANGTGSIAPSNTVTVPSQTTYDAAGRGHGWQSIRLRQCGHCSTHA